MKAIRVLVAVGMLLAASRAAGDGAIYGCANPRTGRVRMIITSPPACRTRNLRPHRRTRQN